MFMKKIIITIVMVVLVLCSGFLTFLLLSTPKPKTFEGKGLTIELASDFKVVDSENWQFYAENKDIAFMANRIGKLSTIKDADGKEFKLTNFTLQSYLSFTLAMYNLSAENNTISIYDIDLYNESAKEAKMYYCYYTDADGKYAYMMFVKESDNFFYTMNLACDADKLNVFRTRMLQYAISVDVE